MTTTYINQTPYFLDFMVHYGGAGIPKPNQTHGSFFSSLLLKRASIITKKRKRRNDENKCLIINNQDTNLVCGVRGIREHDISYQNQLIMTNERSFNLSIV